ncbi:hypothetical protein Tco_1453612 [Tanacetum coccineum]
MPLDRCARQSQKVQRNEVLTFLFYQKMKKNLFTMCGDGVKINPDGVTNAAMEVESPSMVEKTVEKEILSLVINTSDLGSYPPLTMQETTSAGNAPSKSSYANVTGKPSGT